MGYDLIITEKPSAANKIAFALGDSTPKKENISGVPVYELTHNGKKIKVACAVGHLFTVAEKKKSFTYPSFDVEWKPTSDVDKNAAYSKKYITAIKSLTKGADSFTVACDYDVEGEVIGLNCIRFICNKKDASRMKFSTLTKPDLVEAYAEKQGTLDWGQAHAGETRHVLDWIYGINLSRALTLALRRAKIFKTLSSGRVQGPTLKLIVDRELEIQKFIPQKYWQLELTGILNKKNILALHEKDKFWDELECKKSFAKAKGHDGTVKKVDRSEFEQAPPTPFDLTTLQTESFKVFKYSPTMTLNIAQELYLAGVISYPRTSSQKLPAKLGYKKIFDALCKNDPEYAKLYAILSKKKNLVPNEGNKEDPAHPAIYPTGASAERFSGVQRRLYDLIVKRFFATFGDPATRQTLTISIDVNTEIFIAKGTTTKDPGWHVLYEPYSKQKEEELPNATEGDIVKTKDLVKQDKQTEPPKRYTQASLIKELEKRNLGTKSTRAQIIDSLATRGYLDEKTIEATQLGIKTIEVLSKYSPRIIDEELTRSFQDDMDKIREDKNNDGTKIIKKAEKELTEILEDFKKKEKNIGEDLKDAYRESMTTEIGLCPSCKKGKLVVKSSRKTKQRFIACDAYPDCKTIFPVPQKGTIKALDKICEECKFTLIEIRNKKKQEVCFNPSCNSRKIADKAIAKIADKITNGKTEKKCPKCETGHLVVRNSVYGSFLGCSNYPKCRCIEKIGGETKKEESKKDAPKEKPKK